MAGGTCAARCLAHAGDRLLEGGADARVEPRHGLIEVRGGNADVVAGRAVEALGLVAQRGLAARGDVRDEARGRGQRLLRGQRSRAERPPAVLPGVGRDRADRSCGACVYAIAVDGAPVSRA